MFNLKIFNRSRSTSVVALNIPKSPSNVSLTSTMHKQQLSLTQQELEEAVKLPNGEKLNEWIASHVVDFYNKLILLVDTASQCCTETSCPTMCAGATIEYRWVDKKNPEYKTAKAASAPKYCKLLLEWLGKYTNDEEYFPSDTKVPFPKNFSSIAKKMFCRMFRIFAHVYCSHAIQMKNLGALPHLNTTFKHFMLFVFEFDQIPKSELVPLNDVILQLLGEEYRKKLSITNAKPAIDFSFLNRK